MFLLPWILAEGFLWNLWNRWERTLADCTMLSMLPLCPVTETVTETDWQKRYNIQDIISETWQVMKLQDILTCGCSAEILHHKGGTWEFMLPLLHMNVWVKNTLVIPQEDTCQLGESEAFFFFFLLAEWAYIQQFSELNSRDLFYLQCSHIIWVTNPPALSRQNTYFQRKILYIFSKIRWLCKNSQYLYSIILNEQFKSDF